MRPARSLREFCPPAGQAHAPTPPIGLGAQTATRAADALPELATQIAQARRDARLHPAQAAMLLRSWMSGHE